MAGFRLGFSTVSVYQEIRGGGSTVFSGCGGRLHGREGRRSCWERGLIMIGCVGGGVGGNYGNS